MFPPWHLQLLTYTTTDSSKGHCYRHIPPLLLPHLLRFVLPAPPGLTPVHRRGISPPSYFIVTFHLLYYSIHFSIDVFSFYFPLPPPFVLMMVISQPPPSTALASVAKPCLRIFGCSTVASIRRKGLLSCHRQIYGNRTTFAL